MYETHVIYFILILIVFVQSIMGVGVLVIGTPILLILDFHILEIMKTLLPISILTSLINLIIIRKSKKVDKIKLNKNIKKNFFLICIPAVLIGLFSLKKFENQINFNFIVSCVILASISIKIYQKKIWVYLRNNIFLKSVMLLMGIVHGITNTGGTLLMLFFTKSLKSMIDSNRYNISFFYFVLATIQYLIFILIFGNSIEYKFDELIFITSVVIGVLLGNFLIKFINQDILDKFIILISIISALTLMLK
jgi:uncharacterized membrane protein YfcA